MVLGKNVTKEQVSEIQDITASVINTEKEDCTLSAMRPCYDKIEGKNIKQLKVQDGEKIFNDCIKHTLENKHARLMENQLQILLNATEKNFSTVMKATAKNFPNFLQ